MAKELNEDTGFNISIKTLIGIGAAMATIISMWFMLQADIAEPTELPTPAAPEVTRMEFDMKDQMIRQTIITTQEDVKTLSYVDISKDTELQKKHKIAVIPTIIIFKDDVEVARFQADLSFKMVATREEVQEEIDNQLMSDF